MLSGTQLMFRPWRQEQRPAELGTGKQIGSQIHNARGLVPPPSVPLTVNSSAFFLPLWPLLGLLSFSPCTSFPTCGPRLSLVHVSHPSYMPAPSSELWIPLHSSALRKGCLKSTVMYT